MPERALRALVLLELRRLAASTRAPALTLVVGGLALLALDAVRGRTVAFVLSVAGASLAMTPLMSVLRDKLDGGLEFLTSLPVASGTLAVSRLISCGAAALAATALLTTASALALPAQPADAPLDAARLGSLFVAIWTGTAAATSLAVAAILRFEQQRLSSAPIIGIVGLMALATALERLAPDLDDGLMKMLGQPWFPAALGAVGALVALLAFGASFLLARQGIERFRPPRDRITW